MKTSGSPIYEARTEAVLSRPLFVRRVVRHAAAAAGLLILSLLAGMAGYGYFEDLPWRDGFLNTAMLLGGMGPVNPPRTDGGKLFAGFFALYAGLIFVVAVGVVLAPILHRMLHKFHWQDGQPK